MYEQQPFAQPWAPVPPPSPYQGLPGQPGQPTAIAVTTRYFPLAFLLAAFKPHLTVDGQQVPAGWGRTVVPVPPGQHHVHVHVPYLLPSRIGTADLVVAAAPGQTLELEYRAPLVAFSAGSLGAPPQGYRGAGVLVAMLAVLGVLTLVVCGIGVMAVRNGTPDGTGGASGPGLPTPFPTGPVPSGQVPSGPATPGGSPGGGKPTLKRLPPVSLVGPSFTAADGTYTMAFTGWPFAFRTPHSWGCITGKVDSLPDARAWGCIDEGQPRNGQRVNVILRACPGPCGPAEQARMTAEWLDPGARPTAGPDGRTFYVQGSDDKGRYVLDVSHFFGEWQVGISAMAPPASKADVQKIANDILAQAR